MLPSIRIERARIEEPSATDPVEQRTWSAFRVFIEGFCATEFWDIETKARSETLYIPLFCIADWLVQNWWALLYEPCRSDSPPIENGSWRHEERLWLQRHCLRSADSSLVLPYLHIFSNGPSISLVWQADEPSLDSSYFCSSNAILLDRQVVETALREFIATVLRWCEDVSDPRIDQLNQDWNAILNLDPGERSFCEAAGHIGLDPFALHEWPAGVADLLSTAIGARMGEAIVTDFLDSTEAEKAPGLWQWIQSAERLFPVVGSKRQPPQKRFAKAKDLGYDLASSLRDCAGLDASDPITDLPALAEGCENIRLEFTPHNHIPSRNVRALVGWPDSSTAVVAGPSATRPDSERFLLARALYFALAGYSGGARLVTRASTWDQQASRAFAAELLAPKEALAREADADMELDEREELQERLANRYQVSTELIRLQLQNHGVWR